MNIVLQQKYNQVIIPAMLKEGNYGNRFAVPKLLKLVVSIGMGEAVLNPKMMDNAIEEIKKITGQMPSVTKAKKSIASFKLREGMKIGLKITLRGARMYAFLERLITVALPRVRDFRGVPSEAFDGNGNYNLGVREQIVFPEISYESIDHVRGLQITFVTSARTNDEAKSLLQHLGLPFSHN